jgi:predicted amidophosphoribosyltransferase
MATNAPIAVPAAPVPGVIPAPIRLVPSPESPRSFRRSRHQPRLCRSCTAPLASQEDDCWRCGAESSRTP